MSNTVKLAPFLKVVKDITATFSKVKKLDYLNSGEFPIIDQSKNYIAGYTNNNSLINNWNNEEVVIFGDHTRVVKYVDFPIAIGADGVKVLKINSAISNSKYLYYFLKTTKIHDAGYSRHYKFLKALKIPILPLAEQQKTASFLTRIEALIQKRKESIQLLDELIKGTFLDMFGDPVLNPKGWDVKKIDDISDSRLGKMRDKKFITGKHLKKYIGNSNVRWFLFELDNLLEMDFNKKEQEVFSLKYGDLLICEGGEIGRCAIWKNEMSDCYFQKALHRLRVYDDYITPEYFQYTFYFFSILNGFKNVSVKATIAHLTGVNLKRLTIPIPPKPLQDKFAYIVTKIEATKEKYQANLDELNNLFNATAQKAFKGELNLGKIEVIEKEVSKEEAQVLDKEKVLELIKSGSFEAKDHVNEKQNYDDIRDMVLKLMDEGKITQKFTDDKKMVLEIKQ